MIRPRRFASNPQTIESNRFQAAGERSGAMAAAAEREFDALAAELATHGVNVHAFAGTAAADLPDEVFPNNWVSFHADGTAVLYPLLATSRRAERRPALVDRLRRSGYRVDRILDLTGLERRGAYLEGTGSLVLDRAERVAYACRSPRTSAAALEAFGDALRYEIEAFDAVDRDGFPVYHTNVLMSVGTSFAVLCGAAIADRTRRREIATRLERSGREVIDLTFAQLHAFAGNLLELATPTGPVIALSTGAHAALDAGQRAALSHHGRLVVAELGTIERFGGGSARCMLAEVHLPHEQGLAEPIAQR